MSIRDDVQDGIKTAMKAKDTLRLECLRMVKGALLMKEKEKNTEVTDEEAVQVLRTEVRKRRDTVDLYREHGKEDEAKASEAEIAIIEEFLPQQLSEADVEEKVRAYLADHPEINHAGKLTGAMKKELGDSVDGKVLNDVCRKVLG
jgi:uncharacterized protein